MSNFIPPTDTDTPHITARLSDMSLFDVEKSSKRSFGPLFKAYALALRPKITASFDLSDDNSAFFASTSMQRGVPLKMHDAYVNGRVFTLANTMQSDNSPVFREEGRSYVEYLESYLDHVQDSTRTDEEKLRIAQEKYHAVKREASLQLELAQYKWKDALEKDPKMTFDLWIEKYGYDYKDACDERSNAKTNLRRAEHAGSHDVLRQKELMDSALNSKLEVPGSNMPCAMGDVGRTTTINGGEAPKDVVYRPLHLLPGFKFSGEDWVDRGLKDQHDLTELPIDLLAGFTRTWQGLGFDKGKVPDRTFAKSSKEYQEIKETIAGWKLTLKYTDMQAFEINRGLWNIASFRTILPELSRSAPDDLRKKVFQTTRILMVYNPDLVLELPKEIYSKLFPDRKNGKLDDRNGMRPDASALDSLAGELLSELFQTFPFVKMPKREWDGENELHVRGDFNYMYPIALGVLARKI